MYVGAQQLELRILESRSLKEKRMVLRRIKDRVRERVGVPISEVGALELWQRAELGVACASKDRAQVASLLDEVRRCVLSVEGASLLRERRDIAPFAGEAQELGSGEQGDDEVERARDGDWVPTEWQALLDDAPPAPGKDEP